MPSWYMNCAAVPPAEAPVRPSPPCRCPQVDRRMPTTVIVFRVRPFLPAPRTLSRKMLRVIANNHAGARVAAMQMPARNRAFQVILHEVAGGLRMARQ